MDLIGKGRIHIESPNEDTQEKEEEATPGKRRKRGCEMRETIVRNKIAQSQRGEKFRRKYKKRRANGGLPADEATKLNKSTDRSGKPIPKELPRQRKGKGCAGRVQKK